LSLLEVEGVVSGYTDIDILKGLSIHVDSKEIVSIIGPNGAGKSTLLKTIIGMLKPREGRILFKGQQISGMTPDKIVALGMGYVPQERNVFNSLTIMENLEMGAFLKQEMESTMSEIFRMFPVLEEKKDQRASTLSGGEGKMLAMSRALMLEPDVLLLDEPTAGLSPKFREIVFDKINLINTAGTTILMVEQNARMALSISSRGYVLEMGQNRFEGKGISLLEDEKVLSLYLGEKKKIK
jgi:neutral amino acid transport system ATP-binding protein